MKKILLGILCVLSCAATQAQSVTRVEKLLNEYVRLRESDPDQARKSVTEASKLVVKEDPELNLLAAALYASYLRQINSYLQPNARVSAAARAVNCMGTNESAGPVLASAWALYEAVGSARVVYKILFLLKADLLLEKMPRDLSDIHQGPRAVLYRLIGVDRYDLPKVEALHKEIRQLLSEYTGRDLLDSSIATRSWESLADDERALLAVRLAQMAMEKGEPDSYALLGDYIEKGWLEEKEGMRRAELYRISAQKGSAWGASRYAYCHPEGTSRQEIYACLVALEDHPDLIRYGGGMLLAEWVESGFDGEPDTVRAENLYIQTAEHGGTKKMKEQAYKKHRQLYVQREREQLLSSLSAEMASMTASELCDKGDAFFSLGDTIHAMYCYEKADEQGSLKAKNLLGLFSFEEGDTKKAVSLFMAAAGEGHLPALYNLALCLYFGMGISPDIHLANTYTNLYIKQYNKGEYDHFERSELLSRTYQKYVDQVPKDMRRKGIQPSELLDLNAWGNWLMNIRCRANEEIEGALLQNVSKAFTQRQAYLVVANRHEYAGRYEEAIYYYRLLQKAGMKEASSWIETLERKIGKDGVDGTGSGNARTPADRPGARQRREMIHVDQSYELLLKAREMSRQLEK